MKIAIIDNETRYLSELVKFAADGGANEFKVFKCADIKVEEINSSDLIILSGGHKDPVMLNPEKYSTEIELVKSTNKPVLGICMGFEIIVYALGGVLERMHNKESKELELKWLTDSPISNHFNTVKVQEHHRWRIKSLGTELVALAQSQDGVEIIKHKDKPIYGFQFHPELNDSVNPSLLNNL